MSALSAPSTILDNWIFRERALYGNYISGIIAEDKQKDSNCIFRIQWDNLLPALFMNGGIYL